MYLLYSFIDLERRKNLFVAYVLKTHKRKKYNFTSRNSKISTKKKAQVSFSDHLSSVECLSVSLFVYKLFTFSSCSPEPMSLFQVKLITK